LIAASPVAGQRTLEKVPKRPRLAADADTNSSLAYYTAGVTALSRDPEKAAAAFYWATRLEVFDEVIKRNPDQPEYRFWRAQGFLAQGQIASARASVQSALGLTRSVEADLPGVGWVSHAYMEYCVGFLFELSRQPDSARAAYERALLDDLKFHPAHRQLARVRLALHDTAAALAEFHEAAALAPQDATYLYELGMLLTVTGQPDSGVATLLRATTVEPWYALPHFTLGLVYHSSGFSREAARHLTAFLQLAPSTMGPAIAAARERLATLGEQ
jgi:tetratricopeptide (TPR) repeat protein